MAVPTVGIHPDQSRGWIRRVWPVVAQYRMLFVAASVAGLVSTAATVAVPVVLGRGVDAAAAGNNAGGYVVVLAALGLVRFGAGFVYRFGLFGTAHRIEADLRHLVFERLTQLSFSYWDRVQTGQVISRANSDVRSIQLLFAFGPLVGMQLVLLVMGTVAMFALSLRLSLVALAPLPLVLYVAGRLRNRVFPLSWVTQARMADLATIVDENIQGAQIVRAFAREPNQVRLLARSARRLRWAGVATADARARHAPLMEALPRLGLALVLLVGGLAAIDGQVAVGDIVAFNAFVIIMATPFRLIGFILIRWQQASAAALRVFEIIDEQPEIREREHAVALPQPEGRVEMRDVTFAYPHASGPPVLEGFNMVVAPGETVAVVGRTGSGKSTIARLLPRFYDPDRGEVRIDGIDVRDLRLADLRSAVAVVTDDPFLFATSVADNVTFADPDADEATMLRALEDAAAREFTEEMSDGHATELGERGSTVSGGQRQRLAIARALVADPAVLVLDDATSAIDVEVEQRIHQALRARRRHHTTILIAHRLSTIALADRVVFIEGGKVAAEGTHEDLLSRVPAYAEVLTASGAGNRRASSGWASSGWAATVDRGV